MMAITIILPTKINVKKAQYIIDNIFTNQIHPDMESGNMTLTISDHLPSFLVIPRDNQNHVPKKQNLYTRNTQKFICDYLEIDWDKFLEANKNNANKSMKSF